MASLNDFTVNAAGGPDAMYAPAGAFMAKPEPLSGWTLYFASNPGTATMIIGVLAVLVLLLILYYHGCGPIGPFASCACKKSKKTGSADTELTQTADTETENLIDAINKS